MNTVGGQIARAILLSVVAVIVAPLVGAADQHEPTGASPELNRRFVDPDLDVDTWVRRFEVESREVFAEEVQIDGFEENYFLRFTRE